MRLVAAALADLPALPLNLARAARAQVPHGAGAGDCRAVPGHGRRRNRVCRRAHATTAVPLTSAEREALAQRLEASTGHPVELETDVDPELLGGVVVQIGDRLIDASVRGRLDALRKTLV